MIKISVSIRQFTLGSSIRIPGNQSKSLSVELKVNGKILGTRVYHWKECGDE